MVASPDGGIPSLAALAGFSVGVTADARRHDHVEALGHRGAKVVHGPSVGAVPVNEREALEAALDQVLLRPPDVVILAGDVSAERWRGAVEGLGRGPAVHEALADARVMTAPASGRAVSAGLLDVEPATSRVAVATDAGASPIELVASLRRAGADVVELPVPSWRLPEDRRPALALVGAVVEGSVDAVVFTAPDEVRNFVDLAAGTGSGEAVVAALAADVIAACVGDSCADAAMALGMAPLAQPGPDRVEATVEALAAALEATIVHLRLAGVEVVLRGTLAVVGGEHVWLAERERALLAELARRPGVVVAKSDLLRRVWRSSGPDGADGHAVEVAVGRLRLRLGPAGAGVQTVPRRGYRLVPH
ncbi:MAG: uroporphyrinogen-III synthase [Acidimicrobiales bacterium]